MIASIASLGFLTLVVYATFYIKVIISASKQKTELTMLISQRDV
jgi:hypothetical protein